MTDAPVVRMDTSYRSLVVATRWVPNISNYPFFCVYMRDLMLRVHCRNADSFVSVEKIIQFIETCEGYADKILICVRIVKNYSECDHNMTLCNFYCRLAWGTTLSSLITWIQSRQQWQLCAAATESWSRPYVHGAPSRTP